MTYLDMVLRGRPGSSTPEKSVRKVAEVFGIRLQGSEKEQENRVAGLGPLVGVGAGLAAGIAAAGLRTAGWRPGRTAGTVAASAMALLAGNAPMIVLRVTDPRQWSVADWAADIIPHLAFGAAAEAVFRGMDA
ncbi:MULTISPECIES: hypothetical protein [unclassified Pseudarthrobacter]|uniref:hypothetical protein n=1 Tax=unclassified Pseudarthrobacter TaxID=2647000 RepID=UPI002556C9FD|nr:MULTISPECIES: hypothetical protein [unclassified Pseudarthrobacter]